MRKLVCAAAACCVLAGASVAMASPDFVLDGTTAELSGKQVFRKFHLINGAKLTIKKGTDTQPDAGKLYVIAHEIVIDETSSIDGTGAGYPGALDGDGLSAIPGGGGKGAVGADSGGGGGYGGKGGPGVLASCVVVTGAVGGSAFGGDTAVQLGSSGSAAGSTDGDSGGRGGAGGGLIDLRASSLKLLGQVIVDGEAGQVFAGDDSSGGGSGGGIWIQSPLFDAAGGQLRAIGGLGGKSSKDEGGSGGGGYIVLRVNNPQVSAASLIKDVKGGAASCASARGGDGVVHEFDASECVDLDQDGVTSKACGGEDCDDSDDQVKPGATEVCNGQDDDCDGDIDDGAEAGCAGGACVGGECVAADGGVDGGEDAAIDEGGVPDGAADGGSESGIDGGPPKSEPELYEFRGGCAQARGSRWGGLFGVMASSVLLLGWRRVSNRRRQRRTSAAHAAARLTTCLTGWRVGP